MLHKGSILKAGYSHTRTRFENAPVVILSEWLVNDAMPQAPFDVQS